jgi:hypothetical protein
MRVRDVMLIISVLSQSSIYFERCLSGFFSSDFKGSYGRYFTRPRWDFDGAIRPTQTQQSFTPFSHQKHDRLFYSLILNQRLTWLITIDLMLSWRQENAWLYFDYYSRALCSHTSSYGSWLMGGWWTGFLALGVSFKDLRFPRGSSISLLMTCSTRWMLMHPMFLSASFTPMMG